MGSGGVIVRFLDNWRFVDNLMVKHNSPNIRTMLLGLYPKCSLSTCCSAACADFNAQEFTIVKNGQITTSMWRKCSEHFIPLSQQISGHQQLACRTRSCAVYTCLFLWAGYVVT